MKTAFCIAFSWNGILKGKKKKKTYFWFSSFFGTVCTWLFQKCQCQRFPCKIVKKGTLNYVKGIVRKKKQNKKKNGRRGLFTKIAICDWCWLTLCEFVNAEPLPLINLPNERNVLSFYSSILISEGPDFLHCHCIRNDQLLPFVYSHRYSYSG